ncbi:MAG TPA: peptidyl-dipeptidase Dcp [Acidobacteriaceae bacterium]|nr:peptidyl-dipeptidase Dcp [Acidobacteriaceae bacterium]
MMKSVERMCGLVMVGAMMAGAAGAQSGASNGAGAFGPSNPFYAASKLPFQAPPFNKIKDADYQPAIEAGIAQQMQEMDAIANNPAAPTFDNTIVAMEKTGQLLNRVTLVFFGVTQANTNDTLQKVQDIETPKLAALQDSIYLNNKLFARVQKIYDARATLKLDAESLRLVEVDYRAFVKAGAKLSDADKTKLKKLNEEEAVLSNTFMNKLLAGTKAAAYTTTDKSKLAGLSDAQVQAATVAAKERGATGYVIPLQNTTQQPDLTFMSDRDARKALFGDSWTRTERNDANDTRATIARLAQVRAGKAKLLGFPNYAAWVLQDQMAKTPEAAQKFMDALVGPATARAKSEQAEIQALIDKQNAGKGGGMSSGSFQVQPWDWNFYAEQVRKAKYDLDDSQVKPYFEINRVLQDGVFYAANQLYGLTFQERKDIPVYQPDVKVFEVFDANGKPMALAYFDYFKRDNKTGGAWMSNFVGQSTLLKTLPVIYNVANFQKPAPGQPALISFSDVTTMFHEFGHGLHGMFANTEYPSLSGTATPRDFVEFPSQFNEHWASYPAVFKHFAVHYKTGAPMPDELVAKIKKAAKFDQGYLVTEALAAAQLDMQWHMLPGNAPLENVDDFEKAALIKMHLNLAAVPPRYRSSYFLHIWANGYAAGYYAYSWTQMLDDAAYQWFEDHGGLTRTNGDRFRTMVLSRGNTQDLDKMYSTWLGAQPTVAPMLKDLGLVDDGK